MHAACTSARIASHLPSLIAVSLPAGRPRSRQSLMPHELSTPVHKWGQAPTQTTAPMPTAVLSSSRSGAGQNTSRATERAQNERLTLQSAHGSTEREEKASRALFSVCVRCASREQAPETCTQESAQSRRPVAVQVRTRETHATPAPACQVHQG